MLEMGQHAGSDCYRQVAHHMCGGGERIVGSIGNPGFDGAGGALRKVRVSSGSGVALDREGDRIMGGESHSTQTHC